MAALRNSSPAALEYSVRHESACGPFGLNLLDRLAKSERLPLSEYVGEQELVLLASSTTANRA